MRGNPSLVPTQTSNVTTILEEKDDSEVKNRFNFMMFQDLIQKFACQKSIAEKKLALWTSSTKLIRNANIGIESASNPN